MTPHPAQDSTFWMAAAAVMVPFLSFSLIFLWTRAYARISAFLSISAVACSLLMALILLAAQGSEKHSFLYQFPWLSSGTFSISFGFLLDPLSLLMLSLVAGISLLVQVYSLGYMSDDPGFSRYYAFQSLFAGAMMALTLSSSLLQLYFFWELVGLCSYLLIGFWVEKFSATEAGKKAFVMTRLGDVSFFLGILLLLLNLGNLDISQINSADVAASMSQGCLTLSALLIFGGIMGKSAQFPLMTWLPDAMEGPTPVSALLHSATMVAAGVFLLARLFPFFSHSPTAMTFFLFIGTITMLMASTMALVDRDLKKIWAYSTISQLGYMIMALAAGDSFAGVFHLFTHAGFKALLFLCAGVWIHYYETNDIYEIGRRAGRRFMVPLICLVLAGASLSGIPPLAGFFSKEAVLGSLARLSNPLWLLAGLIGVFLTPYYTFRAVFIILFPKSGYPEKPIPSEFKPSDYWVMVLPLMVLASFILLAGFWEDPLKHFLGSQAHNENSTVLTCISLILAFGSLLLAWFEFGRSRSLQIGFLEKRPFLKNLFGQRWYLDQFYRAILNSLIYRSLAGPLTENDRRVIDGGLEALCNLTKGGGRLASFLQSGKVRYNLFMTFTVLVLISFYFFFAG
jgi:NADH-quinone oxidoreductase subunit L